MPRWIIVFASLVFVGFAHAESCDEPLGGESRTIALRIPSDAALAYLREKSPGVRVVLSMSIPTEDEWHVMIEVDRGELGVRTETYEVIENDDNTCTVRPLWAQG